ncbi:hypothetical protein Ga0123462_0842 [Mariprofundus ferrinatatus]|uniref:Uncharacterized protein n=2 Tax=Mariprofundus ferrinatatus TaxID=1921087 RepID=A0A2K8L775_9PROT|nr:hypothetical protein Ga0123462_0842 [Mariprofundus ferrinatatus]
MVAGVKAALKIHSITKNTRALPDDEIIKLSHLSDETKGTKKVGELLGRKKLPPEVLEDTYLRLAIHQGRLGRIEAEGMYSRLGNVPGFRSTLSKVIGNNPNKSSGHLNELRIADTAASIRGFKVLGIGERFSDGKKMAPTDIDIILGKGQTKYIIEAKDYHSSTAVKMDHFRSDLDSLVQYKKEHSSEYIIPIFSLTNKPNDLNVLKLLIREANRRDVHLIIGTPGEQVQQIKILGEIL